MPTRLSLLERYEKTILGACLAVFLLVSLATVTHTPTVSTDEAPYADPAASWYLGDGFSSTLWAQAPDAFWCGNVPLYQFLLCLCFKLAGFGLFQARLVNVVLSAGGVLLIWAAVRRAGIVRTSAGRITTVILALSGSVSTLTFRTIRPDTTMFFVCAVVFFFSSLRAGSRSRCWLAGLTSALLPAAGVPMLPYAGLLILIHLACFGLADLALLVSIGLGVAGGIGILLAFYHHFASIKSFLEIIAPFTAVGGGYGGSYWSTKLLGNPADGPDADSIFTCFFGRPFEFLHPNVMFDVSAALLFLVFLVAGAAAWPAADRLLRRQILFVGLITVLVPPVMHLAGHYHAMYRWMTYIPLAIAVPWLLEKSLAVRRGVAFRWFVTGAIALAAALGVPARTLSAVPDWGARSPVPCEEIAASVVRSNDVVLCHFKVWFFIRPYARRVYCWDLPVRGRLDRAVDFPTNRISLLCVYPGDYESVIRTIGGQWEKVPLGKGPGIAAYEKSRYAVEYYRRKAE